MVLELSSDIAALTRPGSGKMGVACSLVDTSHLAFQDLRSSNRTPTCRSNLGFRSIEAVVDSLSQWAF
jgi:hypothetical protein